MTHMNFNHANAEYIPANGQGRTLRVWFTGRDWCGEDSAFGTVHHMPSPRGLDRKALEAAGWIVKTEFDA